MASVAAKLLPDRCPDFITYWWIEAAETTQPGSHPTCEPLIAPHSPTSLRPFSGVFNGADRS